MLKFDVLKKSEAEPEIIATCETAFAAVNYAQDIGATWVAEHGGDCCDIIADGAFTKLAYREYPKLIRAFPWFVRNEAR